MTRLSGCSLVASNRLHRGALGEAYHRGRLLLGLESLDDTLHRGATLVLVRKPFVGIEERWWDFRVLETGFSLEDMQRLSVADGESGSW